MAATDRVPRGAAHQTDVGDWMRPPKSSSNYSKIEIFYHLECAAYPKYLSIQERRNRRKGQFYAVLEGKY
jgi:hypothetical protein